MTRAGIAAVGLLFALANGSGAQSNSDVPDVKYANVPFGVGERMTYKVSLGIVGTVGTGVLEVDSALDTINDHPSYELHFQITGGIPFARVDDDYHSWLDAHTLVARRFKQDQHEVRYERHRTFDFFPEERRWKQTDNNETGVLPTDSPLDDVSFLYFIRTLPLVVGETYTLNRYFKDDSNPVTVKVLRKETITTGAGTFRTIVVQPIIKTKGLFSEGGKAEVFFTDDDKRILVALKSKVKVLKSLDMILDSYTPGKRLAPMGQ